MRTDELAKLQQCSNKNVRNVLLKRQSLSHLKTQPTLRRLTKCATCWWLFLCYVVWKVHGVQQREVLEKYTHLQINLVFARDSPGTQLNLPFVMFSGLPDEPQEGRNRSSAVEEFSATLKQGCQKRRRPFACAPSLELVHLIFPGIITNTEEYVRSCQGTPFFIYATESS
ncbi:hypothetical protein CSKR_103651 [Clonorchis sinensis]|uniref:Uncharacterized protein n=1 Tax=Clonorchis sinensis TaxID=79923 RepID=A0A419PKL2_CLOSI|nr:hypothetical protein CSKR_103651 [Clonorchis sinensis]